jgi:hypothetical protein
MTIDTAVYKRLLAGLSGSSPAGLSAKEARTIVDIARLAIDADAREDEEELATFDSLADFVFGLAQAERDTPPFALPRDDEERTKQLKALASWLKTPATRDLAYLLCSVLTISDLDISPREEAFLGMLREALSIDDERGGELDEIVSEALAGDYGVDEGGEA